MIRKSLFLSDGVVARLQVIIDRDGVTLSDLIRRAVAEFLAREEREGAKK